MLIKTRSDLSPKRIHILMSYLRRECYKSTYQTARHDYVRHYYDSDELLIL